MKLTDTAIEILKKRYLRAKPNGEQETPGEMLHRVADAIGKNKIQRAVFYNMMAALDFLPNSPTLMNAGVPGGQLSACFVLPVGDSIEEIFTAVKNAAIIHKTGGGTGFSFSRLRPKNSPVNSTGGVASGPVSFMRVFDAATGAIKQGGKRRGANMGVLSVNHLDIREFIHCKDQDGDIRNFNISVALTDDFMERVGRADGDAASLFNEMIGCAWRTGEPGFIFIDEINRHSPEGEIEATNPCGEQPLLPYEACNLGSINLANHLTRWLSDGGSRAIDFEKLRNTVCHAVDFLNSVIDVNTYPLPEIEEIVGKNRKIGLGVMGWADVLIACGVPYDTNEAVAIGARVAGFIQETAREHSRAKGYGNATVTTIAPTGTISMIADCSSGIEPVFALSYTKNVLDGSSFAYTHRALQKWREKAGDSAPLPPWFVTAKDISWEWHVKMQAAFQRHTDNAVSKTINLPADAAVGDVKKAVLLAYELKCKGITVYRDGSRSGQVLTDTKQETKVPPPPAARAPAPATAVSYRDRPKITVGSTRKIKTGCGSLYVTVNADECGPIELFTCMGKSGGCTASNMEAVARLCSLAMRNGISIGDIADQLSGIRCSSAIWEDGRQNLSCADAIARVLEKFCTEPAADGGNSAIDSAALRSGAASTGRSVCPECGGQLIYESGCCRCSCGYSKCG